MSNQVMFKPVCRACRPTMRTGVFKYQVVLGALLTAFPFLSHAQSIPNYQSSANYTVTQGTFNAGGGHAESANYALNGSLPPTPGSAPSDPSSSQNYSSTSGFWNAGVITPYISLSAISFTFSTQNVGTTSDPQTLTLTNSGSSALVISNLSLSSGFVQGGSCLGTLAPGASCTASITFNPSTAGTASGTLTITSNAASSPSLVALAGTGVIPAVAALSLSSSTLNFTGTAANTSSAAQTLTITNSGNSLLSLSSITATAPFAQTSTCTTVAAGSSCTVDVTFNPTAVGAASGTLTLTSDASSSPNIVTLTGNAGLTLLPGWNLIGNGTDASMDVASTLNDTAKVTTVWKWIASSSKWAFYTPSMNAADLITYTNSKRYDVLATINAGEGFWVNANTPLTVQLPAGNPLATAYFQDNPSDPTQNKLLKGWNLIATGDDKTPSDFNKGLSPTTGVIPNNLITLWAWDNTQMNWYFYSPALEIQGGTALTDYITSKKYLDFTATSKKLGQGVGFWVNKP